MRFAILAGLIAIAMPVAASAAAPHTDKTVSAKASKGYQVADYYKGGKHCRTAGSATVCN